MFSLSDEELNSAPSSNISFNLEGPDWKIFVNSVQLNFQEGPYLSKHQWALFMHFLDISQIFFTIS